MTGRPRGRREAKQGAFGDILRGILPGIPGVEELAGAPYPAETAAKDEALAGFWKAHGLPGTPDRLVPSPRPRHYRSTTRCRVRAEAGRVRFAFEGGEGAGAPDVAESVLEPPEHARIYRALHERIATRPYDRLARRLNL